MDILMDLENQQKQATQWQHKKNQEYQQQSQKNEQRTLALKLEEETRNERIKKREELELIIQEQKAFRQHYFNLSETLRSFKNNTVVQQALTQNSPIFKNLVETMDTLTNKCKNGTHTLEDVELASKLSKEMQSQCNSTLNDYKNEVERISNQEQEESIAREEAQEKIKLDGQTKFEIKDTPHIKPEQSFNTPVSVSEIDGPISISELDSGSVENWRKIVEYRNFITEYSKCFEQLKQDMSLKKYKFECQKAVNIPVNAIAGKGSQHLQDKMLKLENLLNGNPVLVNDTRISTAEHPQAVYYCTDLLAKKLVKQGTLVSSNPEAAFSIATVIITLWTKFPDLGKLILGYFYQECPFLVPVHPVKLKEMSEEEYLGALGYEVVDGKIETKDLYLKRMCGLGQLYFAITMMPCTLGNHPHGLENSWSWLAGVLNMSPKQDISASLMLQCLEITGSSQLTKYKKQFYKILKTITQSYVPELDKIDGEGPKARLKEFLLKTIKEGNIESPKQAKEVPLVNYF